MASSDDDSDNAAAANKSKATGIHQLFNKFKYWLTDALNLLSD